MGNWSEDHWRLLLLVENRCVFHGGKLDLRDFRCDKERHPENWTQLCSGRLKIQLRDGTIVDNHDDWDVFKDFAAHGLAEAVEEGKPVVQMKPEGWKLAHTLRRHLGGGGYYPDFAEKINPRAGLFVVRQYDKYDHQWIDTSEALSEEDAEAYWAEKTGDGKHYASSDDPSGHYYKVFPADTRMIFSDGFGEH